MEEVTYSRGVEEILEVLKGILYSKSPERERDILRFSVVVVLIKCTRVQ
jgi:hypothetical protein